MTDVNHTSYSAVRSQLEIHRSHGTYACTLPYFESSLKTVVEITEIQSIIHLKEQMYDYDPIYVSPPRLSAYIHWNRLRLAARHSTCRQCLELIAKMYMYLLLIQLHRSWAHS